VSEWEEDGRRRRRKKKRRGYRAKNKNPTRQCGEKNLPSERDASIPKCLEHYCVWQ